MIASIYRKGVKIEVHEVQQRGQRQIEVEVYMRCSVTEYLEAIREAGRVLLLEDVHKKIALNQEDKDLLMYIRNLDLTYPSAKTEHKR